MEKNKTKKTKNTFHCKNTKTCCSKMQNINFVGSRKSLSQGYMFCFDFIFFLIMQKAAFQETGRSMKSATTGR